MERFGNYQLGAWLSNGLLVETADFVDQAFSVVKDKLTGIAAVGTFACAAAFMSAAPVAMAAASPEGFGVSHLSGANYSNEMEAQKNRANIMSLRAKIVAGDASDIDPELLALAGDITPDTNALNVEAAQEWAGKLIRSLYAS